MKKLFCILSFLGILIVSAPAQLLIDFNSTTQDGGPHPEAGYQSYDAAHEVAADFVAKTYSANLAFSGTTDITIAPTWPNTTDNRVQQMIDRGAGNDANWLGNNLDLLTDFLGTDTRTGNGGNGDYDGTTGTPTYLDLTLSGLPAGIYDWVSFHHDTENMWTPFVVEISNDGGATFGLVGEFQMTDSTTGGSPDSMNTYDGVTDPDPHNLPSTVNLVIEATGDDVVVRFTPLAQVNTHQRFVGINGFELFEQEPAPSQLLIDFNSTSQDGGPHPEPGYQSYDAAHEAAADFVPKTYTVDFPFSGTTAVTIAPTWPNTTDNRVQQMIDRGAGNDANWLGNNLNLLTDWLGTDTRTGNGGNGDYDGTTGTPTYLDLTLSGLPSGIYDWVSFHHDTENMWTPFVVEISNDGGATFGLVGEFQMTDSTTGGSPDSMNTFDGATDPDPHNLPSTVRFLIVATGDDVVVRFTPLAQVNTHQRFVGINGFELTEQEPPAVTPKILLVSDNAYAGSRAGMGDPEASMQAFLEGLGYEVLRATGEGGSAQFREANGGSAEAGASEADLIIVSRVTNSGTYDEGNSGTGWNAIDKPILLLSPYLSRDSRWQWLAGGNGIDQSAITDLTFVDPSHPFVEGLGTDIFTTDTSFSRNDLTDSGNGTLVATTADGDVALVEWEADVPFYDGGQTPAAPRVLMGGLRYHEDDGARPLVFEDYSENGKAILAQTINILVPIAAGSGYQEPDGGWAYKYEGSDAAAGSGAGFDALDGTWNHDNGSDQWDGSVIGAGSPGGVSQLADGGTDYIRIQEPGDPRDYGFGDPGSNRKIYLGHSIDADGFTGPILQDGFTLSFRAKIATGDPLDDQHPDGGGGIVPWPAEGIGYLGHDGGKGNVSIRQGDLGVISFSLDLDNNAGVSGLNMNGLNGSAASGTVDPFQSEGTANIFPVDNLNGDWHEFWITIQADASGGGTHKVNVYADGSETPTTFDVTAGTGSDFDGNYLAIGAGATPEIGAWDLDFVAYKPGIFEPQRGGGGQGINFDLQPVSIVANEGDSVTFETEVSGSPPRTLQWQRDGVAIEGETRDTLTLDFVTRADDGAVFSLIASNPFGTEVSDPATLTVISDTVAPNLLSSASADGLFIGVSSDDLLDPISSEDPFNWSVTAGLDILFVETATLQPNGRDVNLKVLGGPISGDFIVEAFGLRDVFNNESATGLDAINGTVWMEDVVDINMPDPAGVNFTSVEGDIEVTAGGADIWGSADQGTFVFETRQNNFDVQVRVDDLEFTDNNAKAGIMVRESLDPGSPMYWFNATPPRGANTVQNGYRATLGDGITNLDDAVNPRPNVNDFPIWLRVRRVGTEFSSFISRDGSVWEVASAPLPLPAFPAEMLVGLGTTSHNQGTGSTAKYGNYSDVDLYPDAVITLSGPTDQTVEDFHAATFTVDATVTGAPPEELLYQWEQETSVGSGVFEGIPLATEATLTTGILTQFEDNGRKYRVVVSAGGSNPTTSGTAAVNIIDDTTAPTLASAKGDATFSTITVVFDELVDIFSGSDPFVYTVTDGINNIGVLSAISASGDLGIPDATMTVVLTTESMSPDTVYTVTATGVLDLSFANESDSSASFRSFVISCGFALRQFYFDIPGVTVPELVASPKFPSLSDMTDYNSLLEAPVDAYDNYGIRISGWFIPETSGTYDFYMSSDDGSQFAINMIADDNDPSNLTVVATEPVWNGSRNWTGTDRRDPVNPENRSLSLFPDGIAFEEGKMYAFEALMKEGTGGDNLGVTAVLHGSEAPRNGSSPITGGFIMASAADPEGASVVVTSQPQDVVIGVGCETDDSGPGGGTAFNPPDGGWTYLYGGDEIQGLGTGKPDIALDGTWNANNGSSEWDGSLRGAGEGAPGGVSTDGDILTIEDINQGGGSLNNRKVYFTHNLDDDVGGAVAGNILDTGVTLSFRARLTQPDIVPAAEVPTPDGWGVFSSGKGHFVIRQSNPGAAVAFSLVRESEPDNGFNFPSAGLTMNRLNGDSPTGGGVNSSSTAGDNQVLAVDPNAFHEFWINIEANDGTAGNGTHTVSIYVDGSTTPETFSVTAGTGSDGPFANILGMGLNNSGGNGVVDIDFYAVKEGIHLPTTGGGTGEGAGLLVDFNSTNQDGGPHPEPDYQSYDAGHEVAADFVTKSFNAEFAFAGAATVSITPTWPNTTDNRVQQMIDRGAGNDANWQGDNIDLLTDFLGIDTRTGNGGNGNYDGSTGTPTIMDLTLGGLPPGDYDWVSFHHDTENVHAPFTVSLSTDGGTTFSDIGQFLMTSSSPGGNPANPMVSLGDVDPDPHALDSTVNIAISATGADVVVRFIPLAQVAVHQQIFGINGFELTQSAPSTKTSVTFTVEADGETADDQDPPQFIQWQKNGVSIPGANDTSYIVGIDESDVGAQFQAVIYVPGAVTTSEPATVLANQAPEVAIISPADGSIIVADDDATIVADASDVDGTVVAVEFFTDVTGSLGVDTDGSDGWSVTIPSVPAGVYIVTATAIDDMGVSCSSAAIMIEAVDNRPPVCEDGLATTAEDNAVTFALIASDPDGDALTYSIVSGAGAGSVSISGNMATYTPNPNYNGPDSFTFKAVDPFGLESDVCMVAITVLPVNDAPVCADGSATTDEDVAVSINLTASDIDDSVASLTASVVSTPANGTVSISGLVATYTPAANYCGADSFTFKVTDPAGAESGVCTVAITVNSVNDAPTPSIEVAPLSDLGPTVPGLIVISPNNEDVCVVLSGSATDIDAENGCGNSDIVSYTWLVDGVEAGTGTIIDACLLVGAREVTLLVEDGDGAIGEATVIVEVLSGCEAVEELIMVVNDSVVERGNKRPFIATLKTACAAFERGSVGSALNRLENAFMNKVSAQISKDNPVEGAEWSRIAQEIIDAYGRSQDCDCDSDE